MKILVTGSNGQLGMCIRDRVDLYPDFQFTFTDIKELDITNEEKLKSFIENLNPDAIINCAAYNAVDKAEEELGKAFLLNSTAVKNLAKISNDLDIFLIHLSSDFVFDGEKSEPYTELDKPNPLSVYGKSKLEGENQVKQYAKNAIIIRTSWLYSKYGHNFVKTILRFAKERQTLNVVSDQIGTPTYAGDLAEAILQILVQDIILEGVHLFHYSNEGMASWYDFAKKIIEIENLDCSIKPISTSEYPTTAKRPEYSVLSKEKIKEQFNLSIPNWEDSLKKCLSKMSNN